MVAGSEWFSPTRMVGLAAYLISTAACVSRSMRDRREGVSARVFVVLSWIQFALLLDIVFDWRWRIHDFWMREAQGRRLYDQRRPVQLIALVILGSGAGLALLLIGRQFRGKLGAAIAAGSTLLAAGLWCCECLSYHFVDAVLYRLVGKVMIISLVWISLAAVTCFGAWLDGARRRRRN
jgi:hypothetical protein